MTGYTRTDRRTFVPKGDIYNNNGGSFGDVWGWRFKGTMNKLAVASPGKGCIKYGGVVVDDPSRLKLDTDKVLTFDCPTTTASSPSNFILSVSSIFITPYGVQDLRVGVLIANKPIL